MFNAPFRGLDFGIYGLKIDRNSPKIGFGGVKTLYNKTTPPYGRVVMVARPFVYALDDVLLSFYACSVIE
jgi:hypothetical protein